MKLRLSFIFLAFAFLIASCGKKEDNPPGTADTTAVQTVKLELKLKQGDTYKLTTDMTQKMAMDMAGKKIDMNQTMRFEVGMGVKEVKPDGNIVTENTYERVVMKQKMSGAVENEMEVDTKGNIKKGMMSELLLEQFKKMIGKRYTIEFDKQANLKNSNLAEVMKKLSGNIAKGIEDNMNASSVPFPANPVKVGDTWKGEVTKNLLGTKAKVVSTYTLKEVKNDVAVIAVDGKMLKEDGKEMGSMNGSFDVMLSNGWTSSAVIKLAMDMEMNQQGMKIPTKVETDMKITSAK